MRAPFRAAAGIPEAPRAAAEAASTESVVVRAFLDEVVEERRFERVDQFCDPAVAFAHVNCVGQGAEALRHALTEEVLAFPDLRVSVSYTVAAAERVVVRVVFRGTFRHSYHGARPTNRRIAYPGFWSFGLRDGRIAESVLLIDRRVREEQLGCEIPRRQTWQRHPSPHQF